MPMPFLFIFLSLRSNWKRCFHILFFFSPGRLKKALVEFVANVVQRWLPICALYVNTLQTSTRILTTVKNVESVGELARKVISYFCVQNVFQVFQ